MRGMPQENEKDKNKMGVFAPRRSSDVDRRIEEAEAMLRNTEAFLSGLRESDEKTRKYIEEISESLERDVQRLRSRKEEN